jgi:hypothetical protein
VIITTYTSSHTHLFSRMNAKTKKGTWILQTINPKWDWIKIRNYYQSTLLNQGRKNMMMV